MEDFTFSEVNVYLLTRSCQLFNLLKLALFMGIP